MVYRVACFGHRDWLASDGLAEVRRHRRVVCVGSEVLDSLGASIFNKRPDILLLRFVDDFDRCLALVGNASRTGHGVRCIAVTGDIVEADLRRIVAVGCWGQLLESSPPSVYCDAITRVGSGRLAYPADVLDRITTSGGRMTLAPRPQPHVEQLSVQEQDLLVLLADGLTTAEAAGVLGTTPASAQRLRRTLMAKLGLRNSVMLVRYAIRAGLVEP